MGLPCFLQKRMEGNFVVGPLQRERREGRGETRRVWTTESESIEIRRCTSRILVGSRVFPLQFHAGNGKKSEGLAHRLVGVGRREAHLQSLAPEGWIVDLSRERKFINRDGAIKRFLLKMGTRTMYLYLYHYID